MTTELTAIIYDGPLLEAFRQMRVASNEGVAVAVTSVVSGAGVTHAIATLWKSLSKDARSRILKMNSTQLYEPNPGFMLSPHSLCPIGANTFELKHSVSDRTEKNVKCAWTGDWKYRRYCIAKFKVWSDYILIDCPAATSAGDVFSLAHLSMESS